MTNITLPREVVEQAQKVAATLKSVASELRLYDSAQANNYLMAAQTIEKLIAALSAATEPVKGLKQIQDISDTDPKMPQHQEQTMTDKELAEALKLADWLEAQANCEANETEDNLNATAAELRRLHARVVELERVLGVAQKALEYHQQRTRPIVWQGRGLV